MRQKPPRTRPAWAKQLARQAATLKAAAAADTEYARQVGRLDRRLSNIGARFEQEYAALLGSGPGLKFQQILANYRRTKHRALPRAGSVEEREAMEARARKRAEQAIRRLVEDGLDARAIGALKRRWVGQTAKAIEQLSANPAPISGEEP